VPVVRAGDGDDAPRAQAARRRVDRRLAPAAARCGSTATRACSSRPARRSRC
jgi:hypothetical protein